MTAVAQRVTVAARLADGEVAWFRIAGAKHWSATTLLGGELFRVADHWLLLEPTSAILGEPAILIDDEAALAWLLANGYEPPSELSAVAERRLLR